MARVLDDELAFADIFRSFYVAVDEGPGRFCRPTFQLQGNLLGAASSVGKVWNACLTRTIYSSVTQVHALLLNLPILNQLPDHNSQKTEIAAIA
jgi:hypothetical protein